MIRRNTMSVLIDNRQELIAVDDELEAYVERVVNGVLEFEECEEEYEVSISFVDNEEIRSLNKEYRDIDAATDVLSFPMMEFEDGEGDEDEDAEYIEEELALGDIVISMERAKEQAEDYGHSFQRELAFLLVHGMLHLLGYDHEDEADEKLMLKKQDEILNDLGIER